MKYTLRAETDVPEVRPEVKLTLTQQSIGFSLHGETSNHKVPLQLLGAAILLKLRVPKVKILRILVIDPQTEEPVCVLTNIPPEVPLRHFQEDVEALILKELW